MYIGCYPYKAYLCHYPEDSLLFQEQPFRTFFTGGVVQSLSYNGNNILAAGSLIGEGYMDDPGNITIWDIMTNTSLYSIPTETRVNSISYSPNGSTVAAGFGDKVVIFDIAGNSEQELFDGLFSPEVLYLPNGNLAIGSGKHVFLWSPKNNSVVKTQRFRDTVVALSFDLYTDEPNLAIGTMALSSYGGQVVIWNLRTNLKTALDIGKRVQDISYGPNGNLIAGYETHDGIIWNTIDGSRIQTLPTRGQNRVAYSPDGLQVATGFYRGNVNIWNSLTGELLQTLRTEDAVYALAYSPNGEYLAAGLASRERDNIIVWSR